VDAEFVAHLQGLRQLVLELLVQDVGAVTRGAGDDDGARLPFAPQGLEAILDGFVEGLREAAEFADVEVDPARVVFAV